jgi:transcriptional regulator with XRE-family HTH domain
MRYAIEVAAEVRAEMARQKYGPTQLAAAASISRPRLHRRLSGTVPFNTDELIAIGQALGIAASEFMARAEARAETAA